MLLMVISLGAMAQDNLNDLAQPIVEEGKRLYRLEMASWYGTDIFLKQYSDRSNLEGYFSYLEGDRTICIFYSKADIPQIIGSVSFDSTYKAQDAIINLTERDFTQPEKELYATRKKALDIINADTIFKTYQKTNLNLIPITNGNEKKVYVLTGPEETGVIIFGNDYLLTFDNNNNLLSKRKLHRNIISINYSKEKSSEATMHTHLPETGEFITATDICTLMLYARFAKWKQHNVISKDYLNVWNCITNELTVIPSSTIKKINEDVKKRESKKRNLDSKD